MPHARWVELIREQEVSGLSIGEFCRERDLGIHSFRHHQGRVRREVESGEGFVQVSAPSRSSGLRVIGEGWTLEKDRFRIGDRRTLDRASLAMIRDGLHTEKV